ncbi:Uncharacterized protein TCM_005852 [Theobroma cacao]|uniref:Uncharacterized protein n=1 Tax=Theobroma cacao TaxID=3641 RepID=A0A061DV64_THECC|nr:Uncharacterized protein TCM_005852 [Theobroma cacao]
MDNDNNDSDLTFCPCLRAAPRPCPGATTNKDEPSSGSDGNENGGNFPWKDKQQNNATFGDQATIGSLTFNVITVTLKPSSESSRQVASGDVGASGKSAEKP